MINPKLEIGDRVIILHMEDTRPVPMGTKGTVTSKNNLFGVTQYEVDWDNGSKLSIISNEDIWDKVENFEKKTKKKINENEVEKFKTLMKNSHIFEYFNMKFLRKYLITIRESGITNMYESSKYLYMGREKIEHQFKYIPIPNEESFEKVLDMADEAQVEMISGTIKFLESKNIEPDLNNINRYIRILSSHVFENYMALF